MKIMKKKTSEIEQKWLKMNKIQRGYPLTHDLRKNSSKFPFNLFVLIILVCIDTTDLPTDLPTKLTAIQVNISFRGVLW